MTKIDNLHVNIIMLHVDLNKSHVNIIMLHVDIIYLACRGQKYVTIEFQMNSNNAFPQNDHNDQTLSIPMDKGKLQFRQNLIS